MPAGGLPSGGKNYINYSLIVPSALNTGSFSR